jgi:hypothetical protein
MAAISHWEAIFIVCCDDNRRVWEEPVLWCRRMFVSIRTTEHTELPRDFSFFVCFFPSLCLVLSLACSLFFRIFYPLTNRVRKVLDFKVSKVPSCNVLKIIRLLRFLTRPLVGWSSGFPLCFEVYSTLLMRRFWSYCALRNKHIYASLYTYVPVWLTFWQRLFEFLFNQKTDHGAKRENYCVT